MRFALPRVFGSEQVYGLFSVAFSAASMLNNVLIASTLQTVSKMVSEDEARAPSTLRRGLAIQAVLGATLAAALSLGAPFWAERLLLDAALTPSSASPAAWSSPTRSTRRSSATSTGGAASRTRPGSTWASRRCARPA
ncbi:MAG: hypothetical protein M5U28_46045 [Sandaracinaceae bacterium]|nr:hypothetical protein [Sandaracinaceae bacterium]